VTQGTETQATTQETGTQDTGREGVANLTYSPKPF
jgi:hypothetical protein